MSHAAIDNAVLLLLETACWKAQRKMEPESIDKDHSIDPDYLRATKKLLGPNALKAITTALSQARRAITELALPFPLKGFWLIPRDIIPIATERLQQSKANLDTAVAAFLQEYPNLRDAAQERLGAHFDPDDYPHFWDIHKKFDLSWQFVHLTIPNGQFGLLTEDQYEAERAKFLRTLDDARDLAVQALRGEFAAAIDHLSLCLGETSADRKVFRDSTIDKITGFIDTFRARNIFDDAELNALVNAARATLAGANPIDIRSDRALQGKIRSGFREIGAKVGQLFPTIRRKIQLDEAA